MLQCFRDVKPQNVTMLCMDVKPDGMFVTML